MDRHRENDGNLVSYDERFDCYELKVSQNVSQQIYFCPWCAEKLPASRRDEWFDRLEAVGVDPMRDPVPELFKSAAWRLKQPASPAMHAPASAAADGHRTFEGKTS
jgi:hypothetical protein